MPDYAQFMLTELSLASPRYSRRMVAVSGVDHLHQASSGGAVIAFLHYGSWIIAGGAICHKLRLPYTAIASRRNLSLMPLPEQEFWLKAHQRINRFYSRPMFYTDESPRLSINWLREHKLLGVLLDVREPGQRYEESPFEFLGQTIYMQTGPARLAQVARVPIVPASIQYQPRERRHHLRFYAPVQPSADPQATTQQLLRVLGDDVATAPQQQFHDIVKEFARRESA